MSDKRLDDRAFARAVGLDANDLEWLVKDAPEVPAEVTERVLRRVQMSVAAPAPAPRRRTWGAARFAAAAALVLALSGTALVATSASARELFQNLVRFIPGFGLKATDHQTQLLSQPIPVTTAHGAGAITAVVAGDDRTIVKVELDAPATLARAEGTYWGLAPHRQSDFPADLVLPDGNRLLTYAIRYRAGEGKLTATFEFGALPPRVERMRLEVPSYKGTDLNLVADISLVPAETVPLPVAVPVTSAPANVQGVEVGVTHYMLDGDLIRASVTVNPATPEVKLAHGLISEPNWLELTDNLGNRYPLVPQSSDRFQERDTTFNMVFQGPLKEGATELTFTVPKVYKQEEGQFYHEQNVAGWQVGEVRQLDQTVKIGDWTVVFKSAQRTAADVFEFTIGRGEAQGDRKLSHIHARVGSVTSANGFIDNEEQIITVDVRANNDVIRILWVWPTVEAKGPWTVKVPLQ